MFGWNNHILRETKCIVTKYFGGDVAPQRIYVLLMRQLNTQLTKFSLFQNEARVLSI